MNFKAKNILLYILAGICAAVTEIAAFVFGAAVLPEAPEAWGAAAGLCAGAAVIWCAVNIALTKQMNAKYDRMNARQAYDFSEQLKQQIESDYAKAEKSVFASLNGTYAVLAALIALLALTTVFVGALRVDWYIVPVLIILYLMAGCFEVVFTPLLSTPTEKKYTASKKDYPLIYAAVTAAAEALNCKRDFCVVLGGESTGVYEEGGTAYIALNPVECALLTRDELYAVLLHEIAHVINIDTSRSRRFERAKMRWMRESDGIFGFAITWFTSAAAIQFMINCTMYELMATRHHEILADEKVKAAGEAQNFINAVAKGAMLGAFYDLPVRELTFDRFESTAAPNDIYTRDAEVFMQYKQRESGRWKEMFARELPARIATHPTLRQRMQAMNISDYDENTTEPNADYRAEQRKFLAFADGIAHDNLVPNYGEVRNNCYVERKRAMERYEEAENSGKTLPPDEMTEALSAYYGVDNDRAMEIADKMLAKDNGYAYAHFYKARIYFDCGDGRCIEHLRAAMVADPDLSQTCINYIGRFALLSGDEKLLNEYRSEGPEQVMEAEEQQKNTAWSKEHPLAACALSHETQAELAERIKTLGGKIMAEAYAADYGKGKTLIAVKFKKGSDKREQSETMDKIFAYLDARTESFILYMYGGDVAAALTRADLPPLCRGDG